MEKPKRIQLSRKRGWRMPLNTVMVSRPSRWGNPFKTNGYEHGKRQEVVNRFAEMVFGDDEYKAEIKRWLRGKNLACWCPLNQPCHAEILLKIANEL